MDAHWASIKHLKGILMTWTLIGYSKDALNFSDGHQMGV